MEWNYTISDSDKYLYIYHTDDFFTTSTNQLTNFIASDRTNANLTNNRWSETTQHLTLTTTCTYTLSLTYKYLWLQQTNQPTLTSNRTSWHKIDWHWHPEANNYLHLEDDLFTKKWWHVDNLNQPTSKLLLTPYRTNITWQTLMDWDYTTTDTDNYLHVTTDVKMRTSTNLKPTLAWL